MSDSNVGTLGKYQIIREIARSNDIVYEAYDPVMNRRVALKELAMPAGATPQAREDRTKRFLREAKAAGSLAHQNIVTIYEYGEEGGRHFIAMEYLDGHTLRNELDTHGFLPMDKSFSVARQVLAALDYAHKNGVIHRDIKPDNIQILPDDRVKLTDFGIARLTFEPNITIDGQVFGTPSYMSPEQVVGKEIDARSDLFSVGVILYEMLSGTKPFHGDSVVSITHAIMNREPDQPRQVNHITWQFLQRALDKSPQLRFSGAQSMLEAMAQVSAASSGQSPVLDSQMTLMNAPNQSFIQTPYGAVPGVTPPPINNIYAQPGYTQAPPPSYPYNPYVAPGQSQLMPGSYVPPGQTLPPAPMHPGQYPGGVMPPTPVYYPPPPRQPLLKPETIQFLKKLFISTLLIGTLLALIIVTINALSNAVQRINRQNQDTATMRAIGNLDTTQTLESRIASLEEQIRRLRDPVNIKTQQQNLAVLYEELGKRKLAIEEFAAAEDAYLTANSLDPNNAAYHSDLGDLYFRYSTQQTNDEARIDMIRSSAQNWVDAYSKESDPAKKAIYGEGAAKVLLNLSQNQIRLRDFENAKNNLYLARDYVSPESQIGQRIQTELESITQ